MCMWTYINSKHTAVDAKECKKERDRARLQQQKDAINKRRREVYDQRKSNMLLELPILMHPNILTLSCSNELTLFFLTDICNV
jgi:hypothetical protein